MQELIHNSSFYFQSTVYGVAYALSSEAALPYLKNRECTLGGYKTQFTDFYTLNGETIKVLLYIATPENPLWLGDAPLPEIAKQIIDTRGECGHNVEYLLRLADFMRQHFQSEEDHHLFALEKEVIKYLNNNNVCHKTLIGNGGDCIKFIRQTSPSSSPRRVQEDHERTDSFQYTARVPAKKLRCLNI